jgi:hypothetical protein
LNPGLRTENPPEARVREARIGSTGDWHGLEQTRLAALANACQWSATILKQAATEAYRYIFPVVSELRWKGLSLWKIAAELNAMGHATRRGKTWNPMQKKHVLKRAA